MEISISTLYMLLETIVSLERIDILIDTVKDTEVLTHLEYYRADLYQKVK